MAIIYVDSGATGAANGSSWTDAYTTIQTAITNWTTSDEIWVAHDSSETGGTTTVTTGSGTLADRIPIYRVNSGTDSYDPTTGADTKQYALSGGTSDLNIDVNGAWYGLYMYTPDNMTIDASATSYYFEDCKLETDSTNAAFTLGASNMDSSLTFKNTTFDLNGTGTIALTGHLDFYGCTFEGTAATAGLFNLWVASRDITVKFVGCDFSTLSSANTVPLVDLSDIGDSTCHFDFIACDTLASQTVHDSTFANDQQRIYMHNVDSGGNTYLTDKYTFRGDVTTDTTVYYGGTDAYQDADGTTSLSHQMAPASNVGPESPLEGIDLYARVETTGSKTFTVEVVENYTSALTKREAWIEVYYLGGASESIWSVANDREFAETSYTNLAAGSGLGDWTSEPASSRSEKLTATATVNQAGVYMVKVFLAKYEASKEFYYNPKVTVS